MPTDTHTYNKLYARKKRQLKVNKKKQQQQLQQQPQLTSSRCIGHGLWQIYSKLRFLFSSPILIAFSSSYSFHILCDCFVYVRNSSLRRIMPASRMSEHETRIVCRFFVFVLSILFSKFIVHKKITALRIMIIIIVVL